MSMESVNVCAMAIAPFVSAPVASVEKEVSIEQVVDTACNVLD